MKRILSLLCALGLILCLCACGNSEADRTYENEAIGIGCLVTSNWKYYSQQEIQALNDTAVEMAGAEYDQVVDNTTLMYASRKGGQDNICLSTEKSDGSTLTTEGLMDSLKDSVPAIQKAYEDMGGYGFQYEISPIAIGDQEFACMYTSANVADVSVYQALICIPYGESIANLSITTYGENTISELLSFFYTL